MNESQEFEWMGTAPSDFAVIYILFAPTRTFIDEKQLAQRYSHAIQRVHGTDDYYFQYSHVGDAGDVVSILFPYSGEPPIPVGRGLFKASEFVPELPKLRKQVYAERKQIAESDAVQNCMFHLDRMSHSLFVDYVDELTDDEKTERKRIAKNVSKILGEQADARLTDPQVSLAAQACRSEVEEITRIFQEAEKLLVQGKSIGSVLLDFAAGSIHGKIEYRWESALHDYHYSDPNSGYFFLFGELALMGRDLNIPFWTNSLTIDLLKLQRYALERYHFPEPRTWRRFRRPHDEILADCRREQIDREYENRRPTLGSEDALMQLAAENLDRTRAPS